MLFHLPKSVSQSTILSVCCLQCWLLVSHNNKKNDLDSIENSVLFLDIRLSKSSDLFRQFVCFFVLNTQMLLQNVLNTSFDERLSKCLHNAHQIYTLACIITSKYLTQNASAYRSNSNVPENVFDSISLMRFVNVLGQFIHLVIVPLFNVRIVYIDFDFCSYFKYLLRSSLG